MSAILLATDYSESAEGAARVAVDLARARGAVLHVLHVDGESRAERGPALAGATDLQVIEAHEQGWPAERIVAHAKAHGIDFIVMGSHGRSGITRALLGSVSDAVLRQAPCPVVIVPPAVVARAPRTEAPAQATPPPELPHCLVCSRPSRESICEACRTRIRGEALRLKREREKA